MLRRSLLPLCAQRLHSHNHARILNSDRRHLLSSRRFLPSLAVLLVARQQLLQLVAPLRGAAQARAWAGLKCAAPPCARPAGLGEPFAPGCAQPPAHRGHHQCSVHASLLRSTAHLPALLLALVETGQELSARRLSDSESKTQTRASPACLLVEHSLHILVATRMLGYVASCSGSLRARGTQWLAKGKCGG